LFRVSLTVLVVEFDLTAPSMFPGKKGFDRLIYASKNALAEPMTWLFYNISSTSKLTLDNTAFLC